MPSLKDWAQIIFADKTGNLGGDKAKALAELRNRAGDAGQTLAQYVEPTLAVGSGLVGEVVGTGAMLGGLALGAGSGKNMEMAVKTKNNVMDWMQYVPKTEGGQRGMQKLGGAMESLEKRINTVTGIGAGALTLAATGDPQKAAVVGGDVYKKGAGQSAGDYVADTTGSPLLATGVAMIPEIIDAVAGTKLAGKIPGKAYEMGDIGGQQFNQRGAVAGVKPKVDEYGDLVENPDKLTVYHTSPEEITKLEPEYGTGLFGDNLFFGDDPYQLGEWTKDTKVYRMELDESEILDASSIPYMDADEWGGNANYTTYRNAVDGMKDTLETHVDSDVLSSFLEQNDVDILDYAEDVLTERASVFDLSDYGADQDALGDVSWMQQRKLGDLGRDTGYKAVSATDEQGRVIIAPMMGRESELVDVSQWKNPLRDTLDVPENELIVRTNK